MRFLVHAFIVCVFALVISLVQYAFTDIPGRLAIIVVLPWTALFYGIFYEIAKVSNKRTDKNNNKAA